MFDCTRLSPLVLDVVTACQPIKALGSYLSALERQLCSSAGRGIRNSILEAVFNYVLSNCAENPTAVVQPPGRSVHCGPLTLLRPISSIDAPCPSSCYCRLSCDDVPQQYCKSPVNDSGVILDSLASLFLLALATLRPIVADQNREIKSTNWSHGYRSSYGTIA